MNSNAAIKIQNVSKVYKLYDRPVDRLKESILPFRKKYHKEFFALNNVSFEIQKGERIGIIGKNGSGKSTVLKMITGVLTATKGSIYVNGKISALLELGAGFNPEYTGVENVYLNGALMGYSKDFIDTKLDEILSFADIGDFAFQPVKMYSSGMFARLAFAVAFNVDPDVLIVDEALSVGDMQFQEKSFNKMKKFKEKGKTIIIVSHSLPSIRNFCDRAIWLHNGVIHMDGLADVVCDSYQDYINSQQEQAITLNKIESCNESKNKIHIKNATTCKNNYLTGDEIKIDIELEFNEYIRNYGVGVIIHNSKGSLVTLYNTVRDDINTNGPINKFKLIIPDNDFLRGDYFISVAISDEMAMFPYERRDFVAGFSIDSKKNNHGIPIADGYFRSKHEWIF